MEWLMRGACAVVFLGAANFFGMTEATGPTVQAATDECLLYTNLARTGRLSDALGLLTKDAQLESEVSNSITTNNLGGNDSSSCTVGDLKPVSNNIGGFTAKMETSGAFNCGNVIQGILTSGLTALTTYPKQGWDNGTASPYNNEAVQNLMYMMTPTGTGGLGCARTTGCTSGNTILLCRTKPPLSSAFTQPPMSEDFYNALKERAAKNIDISGLGASDLETDLEGKPRKPSSPASFLALPGAVPAAALTFTSLIGFASSIH